MNFFMKWLKGSWVLAAALLVASCGKSGETSALVSELVEGLDDYQELVLSVKTQDDAVRVSKELHELGVKMDALAHRLAEAEPVADEDRAELKQMLRKSFRTQANVTGKLVQRWTGDQQIMRLMGTALEEFGEKMKMVESTLSRLEIDPSNLL